MKIWVVALIISVLIDPSQSTIRIPITRDEAEDACDFQGTLSNRPRPPLVVEDLAIRELNGSSIPELQEQETPQPQEIITQNDEIEEDDDDDDDEEFPDVYIPEGIFDTKELEEKKRRRRSAKRARERGHNSSRIADEDVQSDGVEEVHCIMSSFGKDVPIVKGDGVAPVQPEVPKKKLEPKPEPPKGFFSRMYGYFFGFPVPEAEEPEVIEEEETPESLEKLLLPNVLNEQRRPTLWDTVDLVNDDKMYLAYPSVFHQHKLGLFGSLAIDGHKHCKLGISKNTLHFFQFKSFYETIAGKNVTYPEETVRFDLYSAEKALVDRFNGPQCTAPFRTGSDVEFRKTGHETEFSGGNKSSDARLIRTYIFNATTKLPTSILERGVEMMHWAHHEMSFNWDTVVTDLNHNLNTTLEIPARVYSLVLPFEVGMFFFKISHSRKFIREPVVTYTSLFKMDNQCPYGGEAGQSSIGMFDKPTTYSDVKTVPFQTSGDEKRLGITLDPFLLPEGANTFLRRVAVKSGQKQWTKVSFMKFQTLGRLIVNIGFGTEVSLERITSAELHFDKGPGEETVLTETMYDNDLHMIDPSTSIEEHLTYLNSPNPPARFLKNLKFMDYSLEYTCGGWYFPISYRMDVSQFSPYNFANMPGRMQFYSCWFKFLEGFKSDKYFFRMRNLLQFSGKTWHGRSLATTDFTVLSLEELRFRCRTLPPSVKFPRMNESYAKDPRPRPGYSIFSELTSEKQALVANQVGREVKSIMEIANQREEPLHLREDIAWYKMYLDYYDKPHLNTPIQEFHESPFFVVAPNFQQMIDMERPKPVPEIPSKNTRGKQEPVPVVDVPITKPDSSWKVSMSSLKFEWDETARITRATPTVDPKSLFHVPAIDENSKPGNVLSPGMFENEESEIESDLWDVYLGKKSQLSPETAESIKGNQKLKKFFHKINAL